MRCSSLSETRRPSPSSESITVPFGKELCAACLPVQGLCGPWGNISYPWMGGMGQREPVTLNNPSLWSCSPRSETQISQRHVGRVLCYSTGPQCVGRGKTVVASCGQGNGKPHQKIAVGSDQGRSGESSILLHSVAKPGALVKPHKLYMKVTEPSHLASMIWYSG